MKKFYWLIILLVIFIYRSYENNLGSNANNLGDAAGIVTGQLLIGLAFAFLWWIIAVRSSEWKWFNWLNYASCFVVFIFILHLIVPGWVSSHLSNSKSFSISAECEKTNHAEGKNCTESDSPAATTKTNDSSQESDKISEIYILAKQGDANAQARLGAKYCTGSGVSVDFAQGEYWLRKAAEQGHITAQLALGRIYQEGICVPKNNVLSAEWMSKAAEQGNIDAQYELGWIYKKGRGVPRNNVLSAEWIKKAAEQGHSKAQFILGMNYYEGVGVQKDYVLAYAWVSLFESSADNKLVIETLNDLEKEMTPEEIEQAQSLALNWRPGRAIK